MDNFLNLLNSLDDEVDRTRIIHAPFGYLGGKSQSLDKILPHIPYRNSFVEVFGGSGIIMLNRRPSTNDVYNDRYGGVVAFYRCLKDEDKMQRLIDWLELTVHSREEFYNCMHTWQNASDDVERAAKWYYMHQCSVSNKEQAFGRATRGRIKTTLYCKIQNALPNFSLIHQRFRNVLIENLDWRQCIKDFDARDAVFYLDPPYLNASNCYKHNFTINDHEELLEMIQGVEGYVVLSGYEHPLYDRYKWDEVIKWDIVQTSAAHSTEKGQATECLYLKG